MSGHECYHCKQWVEHGEPHDCWTTTEGALTRDLPEELQDAWERLREVAAEFGPQRIYASHHSIMFSRTHCYFFVRPSVTRLELCLFLGRVVASPLVHRVTPSSRTKRAHFIRIVHRDQVESPLTDWLREAYDFAAPKATSAPAAKPRSIKKSTSPAKSTVRAKPGSRRPRKKPRR